MMNRYVAIDLETTGLNPKTDKITEIGAVKVVDGQVSEELHTLIHPGRLLEREIVELTGIDDQLLEGAPGIGEMIGTVVEFCDGFPLLGHRVMFDYSFLKRAAVNAGLAFEKEGVDTLELSRMFMPAEEKKNLGAACRYFHIETGSAHRALADARAASGLYLELLNTYGAERPEAFEPKSFVYNVKKEQPATKRQKEGLRELLKYHRIDITVQIDGLSRNEVSRMMDKLISKYGRIVKR